MSANLGRSHLDRATPGDSRSGINDRKKADTGPKKPYPARSNKPLKSRYIAKEIRLCRYTESLQLYGNMIGALPLRFFETALVLANGTPVEEWVKSTEDIFRQDTAAPKRPKPTVVAPVRSFLRPFN